MLDFPPIRVRIRVRVEVRVMVRDVAQLRYLGSVFLDNLVQFGAFCTFDQD